MSAEQTELLKKILAAVEVLHADNEEKLRVYFGGGAPKQKPKMSAESVSAAFPEDLRGVLSVTEEAESILVKPKAFLGSETFRRAADVVKGLGGEYVSAGKNSHFRIKR